MFLKREREKERQKHLGSCSSIFNEKDGKENNALKAMIKDVHGAGRCGRREERVWELTQPGDGRAVETEGRSRRVLRAREAVVNGG